MAEITLEYNPFEAKAVYRYRGKTRPRPKCMGTGENTRLRDWVGGLFPDLKEMHAWGAGDTIDIAFIGAPGDFEDLEQAKDGFEKANPGITINLIYENPLTKEPEAADKALKCVKCGAELKPNWKICPECGTPAGSPRCSKCGAELQPKWKACPECGTPVGSAAAAVAAPAAVPVEDKAAEEKAPKEDAAARTDEPEGDALFDRGKEHYEQEEYDQAIALNEVIKTGPDNAEAYYWRGNAYFEKEDYDAAIQEFTRAIKLNPNYALAYKYRSFAYYHLHKLENARADFKKAKILDRKRSGKNDSK